MDKLNEVLLKVDNITSSVSSRAIPPQTQHDSAPEVVASVHSSQTRSQAGVPDGLTQQCSPESLEVHAPFASTDYLLTWPIFGGKWPHTLLSREILAGSFQFSESRDKWSAHEARQHHGPGIREEHAPQLVDRFLQFVHPKNPILYIDQIREHARRIAEDGFGWDATSCIIVSSYSRVYTSIVSFLSYTLLTRTALGLRARSYIHPI